MAFFKRRETFAIPPERLPRHVGIIMDGNGRWAKRRGLPRQAGHKKGADTFRTIVRHCEKRGIAFLTVFAFSTENWKRPAAEIEAIMSLLRDYLRQSLTGYESENIVVHFLGDRRPLADDIQEMMATVEAHTARKTGMTLNIAVNYGGRADIVQAARQLAWEVKTGQLHPDAIDEALLSRHLYTAGQPDPDLILRPSGEYRLSNFLIWQAAYAEYVFLDDILWPSFSAKDFDRALWLFAQRQRRFGGI